MGKEKKKIKSRAIAIGLSFLLAAMGIAGCGKSDAAEDGGTEKKESAVQAESFDVEAEFKETDLDDSWSREESTVISLKNEEITVDGDGAGASGTKLTISKAGTYVVEGSLSDGQLVVEAGDEDLVRIVLNGADIYCGSSAPIYVKNADKTVLILAEGTKNSLSDGSAYTYEDAAEEEPNGTIFSKDDLVINGTGALDIEANCNNGIVSKDDLRLISGAVTVKAANHGIKGKDSVEVKNGTYTITSGGDGIKASNSTDADKGYIYIENGTFTIEAEQDGIQAETGLKICDGSFAVTSGGGSKAVISGNQGTMNGQKAQNSNERWIERGTSNSNGSSAEAAAEEESTSTKAVKAGIELDVLGGAFEIDSADDGFHSNSTMVIAGGTFEISAGDDAFHSDAELTVEDGTMDIGKAYEGIESAVIYMKGGTISMVTSDDGLNAAGGELSGVTGAADAQSGMKGGQGRMGGGMMETSSGYLYISGGTILIEAEGDGVDSNTNVEMSGGTVTVYGPSNDGNGSLDIGNSFVLTGGTLLTAGSAGMAMAPADGTTVNTIFLNLGTTYQAGAKVQIVTEGGEEVASFSPTKSFANITYGNEKLKRGAAYQVLIDGEAVSSFTMEDTVTTVGGGSAGMRGGQGGMGGRGDMPDGQSGMDGNMPGGRGKMGGGMQMPDGQAPGNGTQMPGSSQNETL